MISLIQLEYIVAVANTGQFSLAADKCFVTQPTLSMQVKKMENDLGITLFDRSKQPVIPTDIGHVIIEQARLVLSESKKIEELIQESQDSLKGDLRIGVIPSVSTYLIPLFIGKFVKKYPEIHIQIKELLTEDILDGLSKDTIDVGILSTPVKTAGIKEQPLYYEEILVYADKDHGFNKKRSIKLKDLAAENTWMLSDGHCFRNQVINLCSVKQEGSTLPFQYESASFEALIKLVDFEGGITLIPELTGSQLSANKQKRTIPIETHPVREISLITNRVFVKQRILEVLKNAIQQAVPAEMLIKERGELVEWN